MKLRIAVARQELTGAATSCHRLVARSAAQFTPGRICLTTNWHDLEAEGNDCVLKGEAATC